MTGQAPFDRYADAGVLVSAALVNALARHDHLTTDDALAELAEILAVDATSVARLGPADVDGFVALAQRLACALGALAVGDEDGAAVVVNELLAASPAAPHLAKEDGRWRLHHHPDDAAVVPMWTAICAEGLARVLGAGEARRLGTCERAGCGRVFVDGSKNGSRRFCSTTCQNRTKAAAFRRRRAS